jgi:hypothetical protein
VAEASRRAAARCRTKRRLEQVADDGYEELGCRHEGAPTDEGGAAAVQAKPLADLAEDLPLALTTLRNASKRQVQRPRPPA